MTVAGGTGGSSVVVLNFNDAASTLECVRSVLESTGLREVIVVDNGSVAADLAQLQRDLASLAAVRLISTGTNYGFGGGMNVGIAAALKSGADSVMILNNDTTLEDDCLQRLRSALFANDSLGVVVPVITTGDGSTVWSAGGWTSHATLKTVAFGAGLHVDELPIATRCNFAPGAALLVRPEVFMRVGGFAEPFFLYVEDLELSYRIAEAGFGFGVVRDAVVWHAVQGGSSQRTARSVYYRVRNSLWFARTGAASRPAAYILPLVLLRGLRTVAQTSRSNGRLTGQALKNYARGVRDGLRGRDLGEALRPTEFDG